MTKDDIKKRITNQFKDSYTEVIDTTGESNHFSILIISEIFEKLSLINRHKLIYDVFKKELTNEIHALQIRAYTKVEWQNKK